MKRILFIILFVTLISCGEEPLAEFVVVGIYGEKSSLILYKDSAYLQIFSNEGKEYGKWKGSYEKDSTIITYIELEGGNWLSSSSYINVNDTLKLEEFSIN